MTEYENYVAALSDLNDKINEHTNNLVESVIELNETVGQMIADLEGDK